MAEHTMESRNDERIKAIHEAGHAVIAIVREIEVCCVSLYPGSSPRGKNTPAGCCVTWLPKPGEDDMVAGRRKAIMIFARSVAQCRETGCDPVEIFEKQDDDYQNLERLVHELFQGSPDSVQWRRERWAETLECVKNNWRAIHR